MEKFVTKNRKRLLAAVAAVAAFGALSASAATLGGLNSANLGADQTVVASCDTDGVALAYTSAYDATTNGYQVTGVTLSGVASACNGQDFELALSDGTTSLSKVTGKVTAAAGSQSVTLPAPVSAKAITAASLVISG